MPPVFHLLHVRPHPRCQNQSRRTQVHLHHGDRLREYSAVVENHLEGTVAQSLVDVAHALEQITKLDPAEGEQLQRSFALVQDAVSELETEVRRYHGQLELDDGALESLRERLADVARLERKYRWDSAGLVELHRSSQAELEQIVDEVGVEELRAAVVELEQECVRVAAQLSKRRVAAGPRRSKTVLRGLL